MIYFVAYITVIILENIGEVNMIAKRRREGRCVSCGGTPLPKYKWDVLIGVQTYCESCKSKKKALDK